MATRYDAKIGDDIVLEAIFTLGGVPTDVFEIDRVELLDADLEVVDTVDGVDVVQLGPGHYRVTFLEVSVAGELCDHWIYRQVDGGELETLVLSVTVEGFEGEEGDSGDDAPPPEEVPPPDVDLEKVCKVTHTFVDGGGRYFQGVYVRFRPNMSPVQNVGLLTAARQTTAVSDENGAVCLYLLRGITGLLTISGVGLTREVTVPDVGAIDLLDLMSTAPDLLEVQKLDAVDLPRRS